jgi:hypothetical protein
MSRMMPLLCIVSCHFEIITYWYFSVSMFRFSDKVWKGMQMTEVMTLLTSTSGHSLVKSFSGPDVIPQSFSTGKLFNVSEEPVSDLQSLAALLQRIESDPTHTVIRGSLTDDQSSPVPRNKEYFTATPRQWCMIDIDSLAWVLSDE